MTATQPCPGKEGWTDWGVRLPGLEHSMKLCQSSAQKVAACHLFPVHLHCYCTQLVCRSGVQVQRKMGADLCFTVFSESWNVKNIQGEIWKDNMHVNTFKSTTETKLLKKIKQTLKSRISS